MFPDPEDRDEPAADPEAATPEADPTPTIADAEQVFTDELEAGAPLAPDLALEGAPASESEPEFEPPPAPSPFEAIAEGLQDAIGRLGDQMKERLAGLQTQFEREVRAEAARERIVDRLHAELQEYKQDLMLKVQRPIFVDLIQLHDDVGKTAAALPSESEDFRVTLESIQIALEDVLYRQGVEPFRVEGDAFDPKRQRALTTVPASDPALAKTVAARLRPGFQAGDKVIRPEMVTVYTHKPGE